MKENNNFLREESLINNIIEGDSLKIIEQIPDNQRFCLMTSVRYNNKKKEKLT